MNGPIVIVGGGISGVSCASTLAQIDSSLSIKLISNSSVLKVVTNVQEKTNRLESFDVVEQATDQFGQQYNNIEIIIDTVVRLDASNNTIYLEKNGQLKYSKLCICSGARPKLIDNKCPDYVIGIRDLSTVKDFEKKLHGASRVVVVGNGGIATELVYSIEFCQMIWVIKDSSFGATFFDSGASQFFTQCLKREKKPTEKISKRLRYEPGKDPIGNASGDDGQLNCQKNFGSALGPDWGDNIEMKGAYTEMRSVEIEFNCEIAQIYYKKDFPSSKYKQIVSKDENPKGKDLNWPVYVELTSGKIYGADIVISATGVTPNIEPFMGNNLKIGQDSGLSVNDQMLTSEKDIYAAGDVCSADWQWAPHWFQMRLWTQARQMGIYSAYCITSHMNRSDPSLYFPFELFTHMTSFFGFKVVLLGLYNGQKLDNQYQILLRIKEDEEYVKVIMKDGRMYGALLIGETDLEETFENLIINQLDLTDLQDNFLDSNIDIEDYFD